MMRYSALSAFNAESMSLKFLFSNILTSHCPSIDGQWPHHGPPLLKRQVIVVVIVPFLGEGRFSQDLAIGVGHTLIIPLSAAFAALKPACRHVAILQQSAASWLARNVSGTKF
jgi:hypothetical protein